MNCRYCDLEVADAESAVTHSYWQGLPFVCHAGCKADGEKQEAYECQCIDADCNDCRHYKRGKLAPELVSTWPKPNGQIAVLKHQFNLFIGGLCLKFNRTTPAQPKKWTGMECFEHRRS